jgi:membrane fusion protein (multidrug efflux system)
MSGKGSLWRAVCGAGLVASALAACDQEAQPAGEQPPVAVTSVQVFPQRLPLALEYAAQLRGIREVEVRARVSGIVLERLYEEGAAVAEGEVLFRIDPAPFRAEAERAPGPKPPGPPRGVFLRAQKTVTGCPTPKTIRLCGRVVMAGIPSY